MAGLAERVVETKLTRIVNPDEIVVNIANKLVNKHGLVVLKDYGTIILRSRDNMLTVYLYRTNPLKAIILTELMEPEKAFRLVEEFTKSVEEVIDEAVVEATNKYMEDVAKRLDEVCKDVEDVASFCEYIDRDRVVAVGYEKLGIVILVDTVRKREIVLTKNAVKTLYEKLFRHHSVSSHSS